MLHDLHERNPNLIQSTIIGSWVAGFGSIWATISPDEIIAWVTAIGGAVYTLTTIGILTFKRISQAMRDDQRTWHEYQTSMEQYHAGNRSIANPKHLTTPDPDAAKDSHVPS